MVVGQSAVKIKFRGLHTSILRRPTLGTMPLLESLFGRSITPAERLRQHLRSLQRAQRELERERTKLEAQEKKLVNDIKRYARQGQMVCELVLTKACVQGDGERSCTNSEKHPQVLSDEHTAAGRRSSNANITQFPANGRGYARRITGMQTHANHSHSHL